MSSLLQGQDISLDIGFGNIPLVVYGALGITSFIIAATTVMQISNSIPESEPAAQPAAQPEESVQEESREEPEPTPTSSEQKIEGGKSKKNKKTKSKKNKQNKTKNNKNQK